MSKITGSLASVNSVPTEGTIIVRSLELRPGSRFVVTGEPKIAVIKNGKFVIENVEAGPVQITIQGNGVTHDVRVHVPEEAEVDFLDLLGDVYEWEPAQVSAVKLAAREARKAADEAERIAGAFRGAEQLEGWAESASKASTAAVGSAKAAAGDASSAASSAKAAAGSAEKAEGSATESATSRDEAGAFAERAEKAAEASEESATESAASAGDSQTASDTAEAAAGRAEKAAETTAKDKDATTKSAAAAAADADRAHAEAERAKQIAGGDFAPTEHTHSVKDITDLPEISPTNAPNTIPVREYDTMIRVDGFKQPQYPGHLTHKKYVDELVNSRPAFYSGKGPAPDELPGAVPGDFYFDEEAKELHKITEV